MAWGTQETDGDVVVCDECSLEYKLYYGRYPARERGTCDCKCGKELYRYNGSRHYYIIHSEAKSV